MRFWVGLTDVDWFRFLASRAPLDEVDFWIPSGRKPVDLVGAPFLFKLHAADGGYIVGGGLLRSLHALAGAHGVGGVRESRTERLRSRSWPHSCDGIERASMSTSTRSAASRSWSRSSYRRRRGSDRQPTGLAPSRWGRRTTRPRAPAPTCGSGCSSAVASLPSSATSAVGEPVARFGEPILVAPRLGQGTFRTKVIDAYERRCVVTNERTLPVLQAAHIRPYAQSGPHAPENGLLLRSDLHTLFDRGYVTVTPTLEFRVSQRIKAEFENGRDYYALDGRENPLASTWQPSPGARVPRVARGHGIQGIGSRSVNAPDAVRERSAPASGDDDRPAARHPPTPVMRRVDGRYGR